MARDECIAWIGYATEACACSDSRGEALRTLLARVVANAHAANQLVGRGLEDAAGALVRVATEAFWLAELFACESPAASACIAAWINGREVKPWRVRQILAEEHADGLPGDVTTFREMRDTLYGELCDFVHPRPRPPSTRTVEFALSMLLVEALTSIPVAFDRAGVTLPIDAQLAAQGLCAKLFLHWSNTMPDHIRCNMQEAAALMIETLPEYEADLRDDDKPGSP